MGIVIYDTAPSAPDEPAREAAVIASGVLDMTDDPALQERADGAARAFGTQFATVSIIFRDWQYIVAAHGIPTGVTRRSTSFCAHAIRHPHRPLVIHDASADACFAGNPHVVDHPAIRFYAGAPLIDAGGHALGTLCVFDPHPRARFGAADTAALARRAAGVVAAIVGSAPARVPAAAMPGPIIR